MDSQDCVHRCNRQRSEKSSGVNTQKLWKFRVHVPAINRGETVCITGNLQPLGSWQANNVLVMTQESDKHNWFTNVQLPADSDVSYRYCIGIVNVNTNKTIIQRWETNLSPRIKTTTESQFNQLDEFGEYDGKNKVDKGWLNDGKLYQFTLRENSLNLENSQNRKFYVKLTAAHYSSDCNENSIEIDDASNVFTEVANQNDKDSKFYIQDAINKEYTKDDYFVFNVTSLNEDVNVFVIDFHERKTVASQHIGYSHVLASVLKNSKGLLQLPILCSSNNQPIGSVNLNYLVILPMPNSPCNLKVSYSNYWKDTWKGLEVGHRGMGASFKFKEPNIKRENTIASFQKARTSGADMVEFDVQLSKDLVPVIYHDFNLCISSKNNSGQDVQMIKLPMQELTLEQLQKTRIYHVAESKLGVFTFDETIPESFPLLSELFTELNSDLGFNVEIKWPLKGFDGKTDLEHPIDINTYLDKILEVVLKFGKNRVIVFSCFDPDVCTTLRTKQNLYPVMFLTEGVKTEAKYEDSKCNDIPAAVRFAVSASLLGVVTQTKDLLRDPSQVRLVRDAGLVHFCWGSENNNKQVIDRLKSWGMEGVIFDKIDVYSTKDNKKSIFNSDG